MREGRPKQVRMLFVGRDASRVDLDYSIQDALRDFFPPIKTKDARADFYTAYQRESSQYDHNYVKKYDEDLNTTLVFVSPSYLESFSVAVDSGRKAGLFSAVSSAFIIEVQSKLEPGYDEMNAAYMRFLIHSINDSAFSTPPSPSNVERTPQGDRCGRESSLCEFGDIPSCCILCDVGEAVGKPLHTE
jgi:hypothetical protein